MAYEKLIFYIQLIGMNLFLATYGLCKKILYIKNQTNREVFLHQSHFKMMTCLQVNNAVDF
jgi:hypothetical protein